MGRLILIYRRGLLLDLEEWTIYLKVGLFKRKIG
jgi:hypothetical protein